MTYNVFGGTLNLAQSQCSSSSWYCCCCGDSSSHYITIHYIRTI